MDKTKWLVELRGNLGLNTLNEYTNRDDALRNVADELPLLPGERLRLYKVEVEITEPMLQQEAEDLLNAYCERT